MSFRHEFPVAMVRALYFYLNAFENVVRIILRITGVPGEVEFIFREPSEQTIDQRIAKIDEARANLVEGLRAIDELRSAAEENKRELSAALERLEQIQSEKQSAENELEQIRHIAAADADTLRMVVGIPSKSDSRKQQVVGFLSGVAASLIAAGVIWLGSIAI